MYEPALRIEFSLKRRTHTHIVRMDDLNSLCNRVELRILLEVVGSGDAQYASAAENPNTPPTEGNPMAIDLQATWSDTDIQAWRETVVRFVEDEVASADALARQNGHLNPAFWRRAGELGMLCTDIPESMGGIGGDFRHEVVLQEEMARRGLLSLNTGVHSIAAHYILDYGTEEQKQRWLPKLVSGEMLAGIALTEPGCGSDLKALSTKAIKDGNEYVINGAKTFITNGFTANLIVAAVRTGGPGSGGVSLMVLETENLPGFRVGRRLEKLGQHASDTAELFFDNLRINADQLLGEQEGLGFRQLMSQLPYERLLIAVPAAAVIEKALALTVDYTRNRKAFGQSVFDFQNTRFKLAECATIAHVVRSFVNDCIQRLLDGTLDDEAAYMAKWWCAEQQGKVTDECLQLFGGYGYMTEYPIARLYADARIQRIYGGTTEIMKDLIARRLGT
jgi:acyl-CoA dehydrogenase